MTENPTKKKPKKKRASEIKAAQTKVEATMTAETMESLKLTAQNLQDFAKEDAPRIRKELIALQNEKFKEASKFVDKIGPVVAAKMEELPTAALKVAGIRCDGVTISVPLPKMNFETATPTQLLSVIYAPFHFIVKCDMKFEHIRKLPVTAIYDFVALCEVRNFEEAKELLKNDHGIEIEFAEEMQERDPSAN